MDELILCKKHYESQGYSQNCPMCMEEALRPFAEKECIRSGSVVLMRKEVINARKALGWKNPMAHHGGRHGGGPDA